MERITTRNSAGVAVYKYPFECERCGETIYRLPDYGNGSPTEKLAAYEDAEEQGLLLRLPCKEAYSWIGYKIYIIHEGGIEESTHLGLFVFPNGKITIMCDRNKNFKDVEVSEIGKTVFLTRKEAEAKLAEMEGGE